MGVIVKAEEFARLFHVNHKRKYTNEPYVNHLLEVANIVCTVEHTSEMIAASLLHDVVEDTSAEIKEIFNEFGSVIGRYVESLTEITSLQDGNRKTRKRIERERLASSCKEVQTIKTADLMSNCIPIVHNDPNFGKVFIQEMSLLLRDMKLADSKLRDNAWRLASACMMHLEFPEFDGYEIKLQDYL